MDRQSGIGKNSVPTFIGKSNGMPNGGIARTAASNNIIAFLLLRLGLEPLYISGLQGRILTLARFFDSDPKQIGKNVPHRA